MKTQLDSANIQKWGGEGMTTNGSDEEEACTFSSICNIFFDKRVSCEHEVHAYY
jgi:hypothetical protein